MRGITIYDEPFWRNDGLSGMSVAPDFRFRSRSINRLVQENPAFSAVTCLDRKRSGRRRSIRQNAATSGCAR